MTEDTNGGPARSRRRESTAIDGRLPGDLLRSLAEEQAADPPAADPDDRDAADPPAADPPNPGDRGAGPGQQQRPDRTP